MESEKNVIDKIKEWGNGLENIRCIVLTSSRVKPEAKIDFLSDYDIEVYVNDLTPFQAGDDWLDYFGKIMVRWPYRPRSTGDEGWLTRLVLFEDELRIDFQITDEQSIKKDKYDNGYKVLVDKVSMATDLSKPSYSEFIIHKPKQETFETVINEFWWDAYYVAKYLYRDELPFAKYMLDDILRFSFLHKVINWKIGLENNWTVATGPLGKDFKKHLDQGTWEAYKNTFADGSIDNNWEAFYEMTRLFREISKALSIALGYDYPEQVDKKVMNFCNKIKNR